MRAKFYLTFEFEEACPITVRGEVDAPSAQSLARDAIKEAKEQHPGIKWQSLVVVLDRKGMEQT